jgi:DNA modification methylase
MSVTRINGDMLLVQDQVEDGSIDLLLTDPPYNISEIGATVNWTDPITGENKNRVHNQKFDETFESDWDSVEHNDFLNQLKDWSVVWEKKLRKGGTFTVFISDRYISYLWNAMESVGLEPKRLFTWKKPAATPFNRNVNPVSGCEYAIWGIKPGGRRTFNATVANGTRIERWTTADKISSIVHRHLRECTDEEINFDRIFEQVKIEASRVMAARKTTNGLVECVVPNTITYSGGSTKNKIHPTQKPEEVLKFFIELCSVENDTVLDTFAGSGSTGIACSSMNRDCILIERDTGMFEEMNKRFSFADLTASVTNP